MENNTKGAGDDYPIIPQPLNKNKEFLNWIYERMICVHGEKDLYDYMINFKSIIDSQVDIQNELTSLREQNEILRQSYKGLYESRNNVEKELASLKEENARLKSIEEKMSPGLLQFIADMFDNLNRVSQMQRPFMWNVGLVRTGDDKVLDNLVNVWAGVGDSNPIKRILEKDKELASLKEVVKELIPIAEDGLLRMKVYKHPEAGQVEKVIDRAKRISDNK